MGVFAYTNALPQLELIRAQMRPGDLLLLSPEFDAAKRQFCTTNAFDDAFFCMAGLTTTLSHGSIYNSTAAFFRHLAPICRPAQT